MRAPGKRDRIEQVEETPAAGSAIASATDLREGDRVVYPKQGVYRVTGMEQKDIAGQRLEFVKMTREQDGASVLVPLGKVATIGLRRVASAGDIEGVFHYLGASYDDPELDWKVRHRDNVERLIAGGVLGVAEVVKGLHSLSRLRPLPAKERELYDSSRHLLVNEISVSLGVTDVVAEDYIDLALMPPAGMKLPLKPPPAPVELKGPPWKRKKVSASEDDDLGLADLGIDLGALEGEEGSEEGEETEGRESEGSEQEGEGEAATPPAPKVEPKPVAATKPAPAAAAKPPPAARPVPVPVPAKKAPAAAKVTSAPKAPAGAKGAPPAKRAPPAPVKAPAPRSAGKKAAPPPRATGGGKVAARKPATAAKPAPTKKAAAKKPAARKPTPPRPAVKKGGASKAPPAKGPTPKKGSKPAKGKK